MNQLNTRERQATDVARWVNHFEAFGDDVSVRETRRIDDNICDDDTDSESSFFEEKPIYRDGGYGYVIVAISFFFHFVADGFSFSMGQFFVRVLDKFNVSRFWGASFASVFLSFPLICSPLAACCTDNLGARRTLQIGVIMCFIGSVISMTTDSFAVFMTFMGFMSAIGLSLIYNAAIIMVTCWFNRKVGKATAFAVSGTGMGTIAIPFIIGRLGNILPVDPLNTVVISFAVSQIVLFVMCFFIKEVEWNTDTKEYKLKWLERQKNDMSNYDFQTIKENPIRKCMSVPEMMKLFQEEEIELRERTLERCHSAGVFRRKVLASIPEYCIITSQDMKRHHLEHLDLEMTNSPNTTIHQKPKEERKRLISKTSMSVDAINDIDVDSPKRSFTLGCDLYDESVDESDISEISHASVDGESLSSEISATKNLVSECETSNNIRWKIPAVTVVNIPRISTTSPRHSLVPGSVTPGRVPASNALRIRTMHHRTALEKQGRMLSAPDIGLAKLRWYHTNDFCAAVIRIYNDLLQTVTGYPKLFKSYKFAFITSIFLLYLVLDAPYVFLYEHAMDTMGATEEEAERLIMTIGLANLMSTHFVGKMADMEIFRTRLFLLNGICMFFAGASLGVCAITRSYYVLMGCAGVYGFFISSNYVLQSVLCAHLYPGSNKNFMRAYGFASFINGVGTLLGPPFIGIIRDYFGSYSLVFLMASLATNISGILSSSVHYFMKSSLSSKVYSDSLIDSS